MAIAWSRFFFSSRNCVLDHITSHTSLATRTTTIFQRVVGTRLPTYVTEHLYINMTPMFHLNCVVTLSLCICYAYYTTYMTTVGWIGVRAIYIFGNDGTSPEQNR